MNAVTEKLKLAKVATLVGPRQVEVFEESIPVPEQNQVVVQTLYSGISAGTEMNVYRGNAAQWSMRQNSQTGLFEPTTEPEWSYPMAYGYAAVGRIHSVGSAVTAAKEGDLVFIYSPHKSWVVINADEVIVLPELEDPRVGVLNANLNTAYNGLLDANPRLGDTVVVSGLGVIGLLLVQLLVKNGIRVIGLDFQEARREMAERFGAESTFSPSAEVAAKIRALTDNRGADIVIEVSGAAPALNEAIRIVGYCGTVVAMSWYGGSFESLSLSGEFHHNRPRIIASQVGGLPPNIGPLWTMGRRQKMVAEFLEELDLSPLLTNEFPIEQASEAYQFVDNNPAELIQCLIKY